MREQENGRAAEAQDLLDGLHSELFEHSRSVMLLIDPGSGCIIDANRAASEFYGWSREELTSKTIDEINTLSPEETKAEMARARAEAQDYFLFRHRLADGAEREVEVYSGPVEVKGRALLYSIVHDITARRLAERRLRNAESLQHIAGKLARVGGWVFEAATGLVHLSDEVSAIAGLPPGTTLDLAESSKFYAPEYRQSISDAFLACARDGVPYDTVLELVRTDGVRRWVRTIGEPTRDEGGSIVGVHGAFQDITDQRREQERLQQLWLAVEQSHESIVITDLTPAIVYCNDAACRISGYSREELLGTNPRALGSGKTPAASYAAMWALLRMGRSWSGLFYNRRKDGREYVESASITPVRQPDGQVTHYLAIKEDITEKRRIETELARYRDRLEELVDARTAALAEARQEAESANRAKSSFLARMSHEIRTPMNGILGSIEILEQQPLTQDQTELVATIRESGRALLHIIDDILDFSRIEAGRMQLDIAEFALPELVENLCDAMVPLALQRNVDLHCFVDPELPHVVMGDEMRVRQVLSNLVGNAVKFSADCAGRRGRVEVRVTAVGAGELRVEVEDNGIGISPEAQRRLFQPFSQSEESTTRRFGGSGLGLVICRRLVEIMRGDMGLKSEPGAGSKFWVRLPLTPASGAPAMPLPDLGGLRVGLQEDELLPATAFERYLAQAGAEVTRVGAPEPGLHVLVASTGDGGAAPPPKVPAGMGLVWLARDVRRAPQQLGAGVVKLSIAATRRRALLEAVAVAAGRSTALATEEQAAAAPVPVEAPDVETAAARGELILVAEDDDINRKVILRQLQLLGRATEVAEDGAEALATWRRGRTALVLTDLHMPEMDGYQLARAIRDEEQVQEDGAGIRTPIVALTANALRGEAERVAALGFDDYITKPATLERLRAVLDHWLPAAGGAVEPDPTAAAGAGATAVLDVRVLEQLIGGSGEMVEELLAEFLKSATGVLADIDRACLVRQASQLAAATHKLKSSARSVGALALGALCEQVEQQARAGRVDFDSGPNEAIRARLDEVHQAAGQRKGRKANR